MKESGGPRTWCRGVAVASAVLLLWAGLTAGAGATGLRTASLDETVIVAGAPVRYRAVGHETAGSTFQAACTAQKPYSSRYSMEVQCWFRDLASGVDTPFETGYALTNEVVGARGELVGTFAPRAAYALCMRVRLYYPGKPEDHLGPVACGPFTGTDILSGVAQVILTGPDLNVRPPTGTATIASTEAVGQYRVDYVATGQRIASPAGTDDAYQGACSTTVAQTPGPEQAVIACWYRSVATGKETPFTLGMYGSKGGSMEGTALLPSADGPFELCMRASYLEAGANHVGPTRCASFT